MTAHSSKKGALVGRGCLSFQGGKCQYQCEIVDAFDETAMVQLFEWMAGEPTNIIGVPIAHLLHPINWKSENGWLVFEDSAARNAFYETRVGPSHSA